MIKRGVPLKALKYNTPEPAAGGSVRQTVNLVVGIDKESAKTVVKIKDTRPKVQAQIMDGQIRVSSKNKDDLPSVIATLRNANFPIALQFINYR